MRVAVVGGGMAGLAAAWEASRAGADVVLVEASHRLGGVVRTEPFCGRPVELGPDAFLARRPEAVALAREVGLGADLVAPATGAASIWSGGRLRPLPEGLLLGVPTDLRALARAEVVPRWAVARAALDLVRPGPRMLAGGDEAVGEVVRRRLGRHVHELLVDPLLSGINAGRSEVLSLEAGVPQLAEAFRGQRSALLGARRAARRAARARARPAAEAGEAPTFLTVRGGLGRLADRLAKALAERGVELTLGYDVATVQDRGGGWTVVGTSGPPVRADAVVVALPPHATAAALADVAPSARALAAVPLASVTLTLLAYRRDQVAGPVGGSGFLVPRREGRLATAASIWSSKWPHAAPPDHVVLRVSAGRDGDARASRLDDAALVRRLHAEMAEALSITGPPTDVRVARHADAFPQYRPGHADALAAVRAGLPAGLAVAGNAVAGVGLPATIGSGRAAARHVLGVEAPG